MPTLYWRGTVDGDFGDVNNYVDSTGATPAAAPVNNDTIIYNQGSVDVDAGLTTGLTGLALIGTTGYTGRIGPSSPLVATYTSVQWKGSGSLNLSGNITAGKIKCRSGANFNYVSGTATSLFIDRTPYSLGGSAVVTTGRVYRSVGSDLNNATKFTLFEIDGGTHTSHRKGVFKLYNSAVLKAKSEAVLDDGTFIGNDCVCEYTSEETVASGDTVEVSSTGKFTAASSPTAFTYDGVLAYWPGASINLVTASGEVAPATTTRYGFEDGLDPEPIP